MIPSTYWQRRIAWGVSWSVFHATGTAAIAVLFALVLAPSQYTFQLLDHVRMVPELWDQSLIRIALHFGLSACVWALACITFLLFKARVKAQPKRVVKLSRGSVMAETIIVLPVWMLLVFGLAQLTVNNIAGVLMNVAVYEAARSAWVWEGEAGNRAGVNSGMVNENARLAAALVMTPVAPGGFVGDPRLSGRAEKMRLALALTHVPLVGGAIGQNLPGDVQNLLGTVASLDLTIPTRNNQSVMRALDSDPFIIRTVKKFTHAYHSTSVAVSQSDGDTVVKVTYKHFIAMPIMGPVFGEKVGILDALSTESKRPGYYTTFERTTGRKSQSNNPANATLPSNDFSSTPPSEVDPDGGVKGGANQQSGGDSW